MLEKRTIEAATVFGAAERSLPKLPFPVGTADFFETTLELLRAALTPLEIDVAWEAGAKMATERVVSYALDPCAKGAVMSDLGGGWGGPAVKCQWPACLKPGLDEARAIFKRLGATP